MIKLEQLKVTAIGKTQWTKTHSKISAKFQTYKITTSGRLRESAESAESAESGKNKKTENARNIAQG